MKFCPECGTENPDEAKFCRDCGYDIENLTPSNLQKNTQTKKPNQKNQWLAAIINIICGVFITYFLCGVGHIVYLRLYKRGIILSAIGFLMIMILGSIALFNDSIVVTMLSVILGLGITFYSAFDAYKCTSAINEGEKLPLLFNAIDTESLSRTHIIAVLALCVVAIAVFAGAVLSLPDEPSSSQILDDIGSDIVPAGGPVSEDVQVKITCPVSWSASINDGSETKSYEGTGDKIITFNSDDYNVIAAAVQKKTSGSDRIKVEIIKDGKTLAQNSTVKENKIISISAVLSDSAKGNDSASDAGLQLKITCPVSWSASIGEDDNSQYYESTGDEIITLNPDDYDKVVAAAVQKKEAGSGELKVEIIKDGEVVDMEKTTKDYGVVTVSTSLK